MDDILLRTLGFLLGICPLNSRTGGGPYLWFNVGILLLVCGVLRGLVTKSFKNTWVTGSVTILVVTLITGLNLFGPADMWLRVLVVCIEVVVLVAIGVVIMLDSWADLGYERKLYVPITVFTSLSLFAVAADLITIKCFDGKGDFVVDAFWSLGSLLALIFFVSVLWRSWGDLKDQAKKLFSTP